MGVPLRDLYKDVIPKELSKRRVNQGMDTELGGRTESGAVKGTAKSGCIGRMK